MNTYVSFFLPPFSPEWEHSLYTLYLLSLRGFMLHASPKSRDSTPLVSPEQLLFLTSSVFQSQILSSCLILSHDPSLITHQIFPLLYIFSIHVFFPTPMAPPQLKFLALYDSNTALIFQLSSVMSLSSEHLFCILLPDLLS